MDFIEFSFEGVMQKSVEMLHMRNGDGLLVFPVFLSAQRLFIFQDCLPQQARQVECEMDVFPGRRPVTLTSPPINSQFSGSNRALQVTDNR